MGTPNQNKDKIQREALNLWVKNNCKGTIELATGGGKTRIGVLAISHYAKKADYNFRALIVTPTTAIQEEWKKEFKKWGESRVLVECVEVYCINTAREFEQEVYDIGVFDEVHNYINGEINQRVFKNNKFEKILGLSASIDNKLVYLLNAIAPICYALSVYDALELGLISEFTIYNMPIELTDWERIQYDRFTSSINYAREKFGKHSWGNIGKRKTLLYNAFRKMDVVKQISDHFSGKYGIIFSQTKDYANNVKKELGDICVPHHSGLGQKSRVANLKKFADGRTKVKRISSAKTLDEGVTLPRLEFATIAAGSSKPKQMIQRVGRTLRMDIEGKHAIVIRLYARNTVEEHWLNSSQAGFKVVNINNLKEIKI